MDKQGCFQYCTKCKSSSFCCKNFTKINAPVINKKELLAIKSFIGNDDFYEKVDSNIFNLKIVNGRCIFFLNGKCSIYHKRPNDCRLYPYDIIKLNGKYYLILYNISCIDEVAFQKENVDSLIFNILPWIDDFTDERNYTKMKTMKYKIIKEIDI